MPRGIDTSGSSSEPALEEISEELKLGNALQREYNQALIELTQQLNSLQTSLNNLRSAPPIVDTTGIKTMLDQRLGQFSQLQEQYFKKHSFRILLFPEHNPGEYYRLVWGRMLGWLTLIISICILFRFGMNWLATDYEAIKYKHAWEQVYNGQNKTDKMTMDRILEQQ
jgi:hypothetical protein